MTISTYPPLGQSQFNAQYVQFGDGAIDAFGRQRMSQPYTLFDSQNRFAADPAFTSATASGGTVAYQANKSSINLSVTTTSGSTAISQTLQSFPYQPGKSLLVMQTFTMSAAVANLQQRVGFFNINNGIYFQQSGTVLSFVIRTFTSGSVVNNGVNQADWNVDKLDGTGPSGQILDITKTQILFIDMEWLGVGSVRAGFVINGQYITCHQFNNANTTQTVVYTQTAILPVRYEISGTGASGTLQQICCTVISEGGYEQASQVFYARQTANVTCGTSFTPLCSVRINGSYPGAVIIPQSMNFFPTQAGSATYYEIALIKNATLTGATWAAGAISGSQVDVDTAATALTNTADNIVQLGYALSSTQGNAAPSAATGYNWALALGYSISGATGGYSASETYTLAARVTTGTGTAIGSIGFYNLTV